jgi:nifR3 family TIM-barrel protein
MCFTEFSNANALVRGIAESWRLCRTAREEMPVGIQIFGSSSEMIAKAARMISEKVEAGELFASCIDLNFGCPSGSVIRADSGAALLKKPERIGEIVEACCKASSVPITAKIRAGWSSDNSVQIAKVVEGAGASGITVHWRTATEGRKRSIGWEAVGEVKRRVAVPVVGNGGATTPELAVRMLAETGCDAVMVSSGALGNPRIFSQANGLLANGSYRKETWEEKLSSFLEYAAFAEKYGVLSDKPLRAHAIQFLTGQPGVKIARKELNAAQSAEQILCIMREFEPLGPH